MKDVFEESLIGIMSLSASEFSCCLNAQDILCDETKQKLIKLYHQQNPPSLDRQPPCTE